MDLFDDWERAQSAAIKGLERSGWARSFCSSELLKVLPPAAEDPASDLLSAVTVLSAWYRAGLRSSTASSALEECGQPEPDELPFCKPAAEEIWYRLRSFQFTLPELEKRWLLRCYRAGYVLSPKLIVEVLEFGLQKKNASLQPLIALVAGNLGRWLARFNPDWGYVVPEVLAERFRLGKPAERISALTAYRILQPSAARDLLASTWPGESNADRLKLMEAFGGRSLKEDEPFLLQVQTELNLEGNADGPSTRQLKQLTARILLKNQTSVSWNHWVGILAPYWKGGLVLPEGEDACFCDNWMSQHGLLQKGTGAAMVIHWWSALLELLPPAIWVQAFEQPPKIVLKGLEEGPYGGILSKSQVHAALYSATRYYKDPVWAELLIGLVGVEEAFVLFELLPTEKREQYLMGNRALISRIAWDAPALQFDWSPAFSNWILRNWYESLVAGDTKRSQVYLSMAIFMHPTARPASIPGPYDPIYWREEWLKKVVTSLEKILAVKALL